MRPTLPGCPHEHGTHEGPKVVTYISWRYTEQSGQSVMHPTFLGAIVRDVGHPRLERRECWLLACVGSLWVQRNSTQSVDRHIDVFGRSG